MEELVIKLSNNFTSIITINDIKLNNIIYWGGNGVGNRWCNKKFNYAVIYANKKVKYYCENLNEKIPQELLDNYNSNEKGIIGIYVFSKRSKTTNRPINKKIYKEIVKNNCVICGSYNEIICDHKNDLYNDLRVLDCNTQILDDFQSLCNHCNLQKRQIAIIEEKTNKIYSARNIRRLDIGIEFPWEKKNYDKSDISCKKDTYWYDPIEFEKKIHLYLTITIPIIKEIKKTIELIL